MLLATFKHISSKNADYYAAEAYLTFEHDEFTMKPTLDERTRAIKKQTTNTDEDSSPAAIPNSQRGDSKTGSSSQRS